MPLGPASYIKGETAMKKMSHFLIVFVSASALMVSSVDARGRGGAGGPGGGGHHFQHTFSGQRQFHGQSGVSRQFHGQSGVSRSAYSHRYNNVFNKNWWANHPNLHNYYWYNHVWTGRPSGYWWGPATWIALSSWIAWNWGPPL